MVPAGTLKLLAQVAAPAPQAPRHVVAEHASAVACREEVHQRSMASCDAPPVVGVVHTLLVADVHRHAEEDASRRAASVACGVTAAVGRHEACRAVVVDHPYAADHGASAAASAVAGGRGGPPHSFSKTLS